MSEKTRGEANRSKSDTKRNYIYKDSMRVAAACSNLAVRQMVVETLELCRQRAAQRRPAATTGEFKSGRKHVRCGAPVAGVGQGLEIGDL